MSLLRHAIRDLLRPTVKAFAGVSVRYKSIIDGVTYPTDGTTFTATLANTATGEEVTDTGFVFTDKTKDFKIDVADFHAVIPHAPQHGDEIIVVSGLGLENQTFRVLGDGGSRAVEPLGHFEDTYRIQTKHVPGEDTAPAQVVHGNAAGLSYGNASGVAYGPSRRI